jgi:outer membrane cobalamin receptor
VTDAWKVGADLYAVGSQYLIHDDTNESRKVPGYGVLNLHTSYYQLTPSAELFGIVNNVLNPHYYLQGTFLAAARGLRDQLRAPVGQSGAALPGNLPCTRGSFH